MSVIEQRIQADPADARLLRLEDGRPVLAVIGGGHVEPFTRLQMQLIAEKVMGAWNGDVAPTVAWASDALRDVAAERRRQIEREGWTPEHDDGHTAGEMAQAAACYALNVQRIPIRCGDSTLWPKGWDESWWRPKDRRSDLVRAAALLLAEIERMDRSSTCRSEAT